ncbi:FBP domain-containing protein (plasmid) [Streptomyces atratus]|uniref:Amidase n=1 Tax=Streptomyces atratus TaxID=1893 RepID=A0A1K2A1W7_STRAR|nr:FBP domain-containing protein [Streptomyces atratus]SFX79860.1 Amidase [Streptomyces atratus]
MKPLTAREIRTASVNCTKGEAKRLSIPHDLAERPWDDLDFLGWRDPQAPGRAYLATELDGRPTALALRCSSATSWQTRRSMCSMCMTVHTGGVSLMVAAKAGRAGQQGNSVGAYIWAPMSTEFVVANARLLTANLTASLDELAAAFDRPVDSSTLEPMILAGYHYGKRVGGAEFVTALAIRNRVARSPARYFDAYDVLLTPTLPELPVPLGTYAEGAETLDGLGWIDRLNDRSPFTMPFNVAGTPAMSVPVTADTGTGLPIGMQFAAGYGREDRLFRLAGQLEQAEPWSGRTPTVWAGNRTGH